MISELIRREGAYKIQISTPSSLTMPQILSESPKNKTWESRVLRYPEVPPTLDIWSKRCSATQYPYVEPNICIYIYLLSFVYDKYKKITHIC